MSWDLFVQDFPADATSVSDIPEGFQPLSIGNRDDIIEKILSVMPGVDFSDASWGKIEEERWSIEINLGDAGDCGGFAMHVRGSNEAVGAVEIILDQLGVRAIDSGSGEFFAAGPEARQSFSDWRRFRDSALNQGK